MKEEIGEIIEQIKVKQPLVHNITNQVVMNFTANGLYAIGAAPVMANDVREVADMASIADALLINIGTLTIDQVEAMILAGRSANEKGIPVVFDPVGVGATPFRNQAAERILNEVSITLVRGNSGEISQLAGMDAEVRGVDATGNMDAVKIAKTAVRKLGTAVLVTGEQDVIADQNALAILSNGTPLLTKVTGTGCLLSSVVAAFLAVGKETVVSAVAAASFYSVAAEFAVEKADQPGSFQMAFLDALSQTTSVHVLEKMQLEVQNHEI
ncbi:hydroxyethylthiazole kinase [Natronobacillus azotifigens]|uniref:Hydroxyethylthiazole kinase n=1 Tax=Natronobacillus azotifigens TaxID=472978 RepID=A0A9J6RAQ8_9BACI|nr:hydroxyethylthiazole kinase [Natronobacillus azotifigens]MCZ0702744.1 hydroxyethylthiazole kinase [Natronobacillus azotifigens]